jgi:hypothetical protein
MFIVLHSIITGFPWPPSLADKALHCNAIRRGLATVHSYSSPHIPSTGTLDKSSEAPNVDVMCRRFGDHEFTICWRGTIARGVILGSDIPLEVAAKPFAAAFDVFLSPLRSASPSLWLALGRHWQFTQRRVRAAHQKQNTAVRLKSSIM